MQESTLEAKNMKLTLISKLQEDSNGNRHLKTLIKTLIKNLSKNLKDNRKCVKLKLKTYLYSWRKCKRLKNERCSNCNQLIKMKPRISKKSYSKKLTSTSILVKLIKRNCNSWWSNLIRKLKRKSKSKKRTCLYKRIKHHIRLWRETFSAFLLNRKGNKKLIRK